MTVGNEKKRTGVSLPAFIHALRDPRVKLAIAAFVLLCVYAGDLAYMLRYGRAFTDSDMASEMVLASLLNQEGGVFSANWFYSSEIRCVNQQMLFQLGLFLFPNNWLYARTTGLALLLLIFVLSYVYFGRSFGLRFSSCFYGAAIIIAPITFWQINLITFGGYYVAHIVPAFLAIGTILRLSRQQKTIGSRWAMLLFLAVVAFLSGINGVRLFMTFIVPCCWLPSPHWRFRSIIRSPPGRSGLLLK